MSDNVSDAEFQSRMDKMPTFLCEKRAGVPPSAVLVRLVHWTDKESISADKRSLAALNDVEPPARWKDFHDYAIQRQELFVQLSIAIDAANSRALELVTTRSVSDSLDVVTLMATDRQYRELAATASHVHGDVIDVERRLRNAAPRHYLRDKAISRELRRTDGPVTLDLGRMYVTATLPRSVERLPNERPGVGGAVPTSGAIPTLAGTDPAAPTATDATSPEVVVVASPNDPPPPLTPSLMSGEKCVNGKSVIDIRRNVTGYATGVSDVTVTFPVDHPSLEHGAGYLKAGDRVVVFYLKNANEEIMGVIVAETGGGSVTLKFASAREASQFSESLKNGDQMMVPVQHREGLVPKYTQGFARGKSIDELEARE